MADVKKLPYNAQNPKREALVKAGLMEGGPQSAEPRKPEDKRQAP